MLCGLVNFTISCYDFAMQEAPSAERRLAWVAVGIGLVLAVLMLSIFAGPAGITSHSSGGGAGSALPALSAADVARRAAVAKLGFIDDSDNAVELYKQAMALYNKLPASDQAALD